MAGGGLRGKHALGSCGLQLRTVGGAQNLQVREIPPNQQPFRADPRVDWLRSDFRRGFGPVLRVCALQLDQSVVRVARESRGFPRDDRRAEGEPL